MASREKPSLTPSELKDRLRSVRELDKAREAARQVAETTRAPEDISRARQLQAETTEAMNELQANVNPFETRLAVRNQYEQQQKILTEVGILEPLADGKRGIRGIDGREYPLPTYAEISRRMTEKREVLKTKIEQGFDKMILVPFGVPIDTLMERYKQTLQRHFDAKKFFHTKLNPADPLEALRPITALNVDGPLWFWDGYRGADVVDLGTGVSKLVYNPKEFSENHQGKTKPEIIAVSGGWKILLIEKMPNIPRERAAKTTLGRTQIDTVGAQIRAYMEAGQTVPNPREYLAALQAEGANPDSPYFMEQGMAPEDQMMYAITHLEETDQVIDDVGENGRISWQIGAYFQASDRVPIACWNRVLRQAHLGGNGSGNRNPVYGLRSSVGV